MFFRGDGLWIQSPGPGCIGVPSVIVTTGATDHAVCVPTRDRPSRVLRWTDAEAAPLDQLR